MMLFWIGLVCVAVIAWLYTRAPVSPEQARAALMWYADWIYYEDLAQEYAITWPLEMADLRYRHFQTLAHGRALWELRRIAGGDYDRFGERR